MEEKYVTIPQLAKLLGISRIAVYKKVKKGRIKAIKVGRHFAISRRYVTAILGKELGRKEKQEIDVAVKKTVKEYGEVLNLLSKG